MAKEFLSQLLKLENSITPNIGQKCVVCHEEAGSLSSESGIIECLIRLPCNHLVGSYCIATWLHENNTCPMCRREFFPAGPRDHVEQVGGVIMNRDSDNGRDSSPEQLRLYALEVVFDCISPELELSTTVCRLSRLIGRRSFPLDALRGSSLEVRAGMSVLAASHLLGHPVTLDQLAKAVHCTRSSIYNTYRLFYPQRQIVCNDNEFFLLLREGSGRARIGIPVAQDWPRPMYAEGIGDMMHSHFETEHETMLIEVSYGILDILVVKPYFHDDEILHVVALSIYLASYLKRMPVSYTEIGAVTRVSVASLRATYAAFHPYREDLLEYPTFASVDDSFERLVADLPPEIP